MYLRDINQKKRKKKKKLKKKKKEKKKLPPEKQTISRKAKLPEPSVGVSQVCRLHLPMAMENFFLFIICSQDRIRTCMFTHLGNQTNHSEPLNFQRSASTISPPD